MKKIISPLSIILLCILLITSLSDLTIFASLTTTKSIHPSLQEQLFDQIRRENQGEIERLLRAGARLHDTDNKGSTPLHHAVLFGRVGITRFLIERRANVNAQNEEDGATPLHDAISEEYPDVVRLLLSHKADVLIANHKGETPLHLAQQKNNSAILKLLPKIEVQPTGVHKKKNKKTKKKKQMAFKMDEKEKEGKKKEAGPLPGHSVTPPDPIKKQTGPLQAALFEQIKHGNKSGVEKLLQEGASLHETNTFGSTPLHYAVVQDHVEIARLLIQAKANVNAQNRIDGRTPLHEAVDGENADMIKLLLSAKADVTLQDYEKHTPLHKAEKNGNADIIKLLSETAVQPKETQSGEKRDGAEKEPKTLSTCSVTPDEQLQEQLFEQIKQGNKSEVERLLTAGADKDTRDKDGSTPLHRAAQYGHKEVVEMLLQAGADKDARVTSGWYKGWTPLHGAAYKGHKEVVEILLKTVTDKDARDKYGRTPLYWAAMVGHKEVIEMLLHAGADKDTRDKNGSTPLHRPAHNGHKEVVELLLKAGADKDARDKDGKTPLDYTC